MSARAAATEATRERIVEAAVEAFTDPLVRRGDDPRRRRGRRRRAADGSQPLRHARTSCSWRRSSGSRRASTRCASPSRRATSTARSRRSSTTTSATATRTCACSRSSRACPVVRPLMERGRAGHQAWVEHVFAAALAGLRGKARARRIAQLVVVTDVYAWKLLRRDKGLDRDQTITAMRELVLALHDNAAKEAEMTEILMTTWDGAGTTPPLMSVARALVAPRPQRPRARRSRPARRGRGDRCGAPELDPRAAPDDRRDSTSHFIRDWEAGPEGFAAMRDRLAVGPAAAFAADVREELDARRAPTAAHRAAAVRPSGRRRGGRRAVRGPQPDDQRRPRAGRAAVRTGLPARRHRRRP